MCPPMTLRELDLKSENSWGFFPYYGETRLRAARQLNPSCVVIMIPPQRWCILSSLKTTYGSAAGHLQQKSGRVLPEASYAEQVIP